jgi:hypothetical protein
MRGRIKLPIIAGSIISGAALTGVMVGTAPAYADAQGTVVASKGLTIRTCPSTACAPFGTPIPNGSLVDIICQVNGQRVNGNWGPTTIWDRLSPLGQPGRWVSDGFVFTGSNGFVTSVCPPGS